MAQAPWHCRSVNAYPMNAPMRPDAMIATKPSTRAPTDGRAVGAGSGAASDGLTGSEGSRVVDAIGLAPVVAVAGLRAIRLDEPIE